MEVPRGFACPFAEETSRAEDDRYPCPERYRETCGCQKDGIPAPRKHWRRPA